MNATHLHLLLNHVPTLGFGVAFGLLVAALLGKSEDLRRASLVMFFIIALLAIPAYVTGDAASFALRDDTAVSQELMAEHRDAAMLALIPMEVTGLLAWAALWRSRQGSRAPLLVFAIVTFGLMARAANAGGQIQHPEIVADGAAMFAPALPRAAAMGAALIVDHPWAWPICEILHFVGLCLLFGVVLLVNLRLLDVMPGVAFADLHRLLPWAMAGLTLNLVTGMLFFLASPDQYTQNGAFFWKMALIVVGGLTLLYPTISEEVRALKAGARASRTATMMAAASLFVWVGVIFFGRFLPYLGSE